MTELVLDINALPSYLTSTLRSKKVRVREENKIVTIVPEPVMAKNYCCPFLGIAADSKMTVEKFLEWKNEEREAEHEKELRP
jgi:glyoxylate carboligase